MSEPYAQPPRPVPPKAPLLPKGKHWMIMGQSPSHQYHTNITPISHQYHTNITPISYQYRPTIALPSHHHRTTIQTPWKLATKPPEGKSFPGGLWLNGGNKGSSARRGRSDAARLTGPKQTGKDYLAGTRRISGAANETEVLSARPLQPGHRCCFSQAALHYP
jgi:hypothetical protein